MKIYGAFGYNKSNLGFKLNTTFRNDLACSTKLPEKVYYSRVLMLKYVFLDVSI